MAEPGRHLFILAGEPSGDRIAADLVRRLRDRLPLRLSGVGGEALRAEGLVSLFPMADLAVMGWSDVIARLPLLLWRVRQTARAILAARPDLVVLVDSQVFSALVARQVRSGGGSMPMLLYVAPSVWAWKPERARALAPLFDAVLAVLPFEPAVMQKLGGPPTFYVGHPALQQFDFRAEQPARGPVLLLPGSRTGELRRHARLLRDVATRLAGMPAIEAFVVPTPTHLLPAVEAETATWPVEVEVVSGEAEKRQAFRRAVAACATTGTVTLELALAGVPMVTTYVADKGQAKNFKAYAVRFAALPNIVADRLVVPEHLFTTPEPDVVGDDLADLLVSPARIDAQRSAFAEIRALMETGTSETPRSDPAEYVLALLR